MLDNRQKIPHTRQQTADGRQRERAEHGCPRTGDSRQQTADVRLQTEDRQQTAVLPRFISQTVTQPSRQRSGRQLPNAQQNTVDAISAMVSHLLRLMIQLTMLGIFAEENDLTCLNMDMS